MVRSTDNTDTIEEVKTGYAYSKLRVSVPVTATLMRHGKYGHYEQYRRGEDRVCVQQATSQCSSSCYTDAVRKVRTVRTV
jgi:hypothetical protein